MYLNMAADVALAFESFRIFLIFGFFSGLLSHDALDERVFLPNDNTFSFGEAKATRYLLYDVNPGEGFNLRRDVYMRVANLVKILNEDEPWTLVLPPWGRLYHWKTPNLSQTKIPWSTFFDIPSLNRHIPVIEFLDFLRVIGEPKIEQVYYLQRYKEGWQNGNFEEKMDIRECLGQNQYYQMAGDSSWYGWFYDYQEVYAEKFQCISLQGHYGVLKPFLLYNTTARSVMVDRAETTLHERYGQSLYWQIGVFRACRGNHSWAVFRVQSCLLDCTKPSFVVARRSMVYAKHLKKIGDNFRAKYLESTDELDKTVMADDWTRVRKAHGDAVGGPYLAVHLRRQDYLRGHPEDVPSLKNAAKQIETKLMELNLDRVFIATDASTKDYEKLKSLLPDYKVYRFIPTEEQLKKYKDGGMTIIDQWIAAHARFFLGTHVSTVSFRIQEEREIMGFLPTTTFNCLCGDKKPKCEQPSKWTILY